MGPWAANPGMGSTQIWIWLIGSKPHQKNAQNVGMPGKFWEKHDHL
jgi:hypothetical protein